MALSHHVMLAEELVSTVARAFYTDHVVVVLDTLIREKYLIEEEIGPRLKLSGKETRKVVTQLEEEKLIKSEKVPIEGDNSSYWKCLYIDYQTFVNVVRYRVHLMQDKMMSEETSELSDVKYSCPTCRTVLSSLDAMRALSKDHKFICTYCSPYQNYRDELAEPFFTLVLMDSHRSISSLQSMQKKVADQLRRVAGQHQGIFDLLSRLREVSLPRNLPSENIKRGFVSSVIEDEEVKNEIRSALSFSRMPGGSYLRKRSVDHMEQLSSQHRTGHRVEVRMQDDLAGGQTGQQIGAAARHAGVPLAAVDTSYIFAQRDASMPDFLQNSRVAGADEVYKQVQSLQKERSHEDAAPAQPLATPVEEAAAGTKGTGQEGVEEADEAAPEPPAEEEQDMDDIDWES